MSLHKDLQELIDAGIVSSDTAEKIHIYYQSKSQSSSNRLFLVFAILGALLIGLGIILIVAHNWDGLSRNSKTALSFTPMIIGQIACGYAVWKKMDNQAWREGSATFLFFAVGASISLISQVYNIPGNINAFVISWMLLCLPLVYILKSSVVSLLYIVGITNYVVSSGFSKFSDWPDYYYWPLLLLILPHYYFLFKEKTVGNFLNIHHLFIPVSLMFALPSLAQGEETFLLSAYMSLFGCLYLIGHSKYYKPQINYFNVFTAIGSVGTVCLLLGCSFYDVWQEVSRIDNHLSDQLLTMTFLTTALLTLAAFFLFYKNLKDKGIKEIKPIAPIFIIFLLILLLGFSTSFSVVLINLLIFAIGVMTIREGALKDHLGILNYGLLIITSLIAFRFFDGELSFVWRGIMFLIVGIGFFLTNNWILKKRKVTSNE